MARGRTTVIIWWRVLAALTVVLLATGAVVHLFITGYSRPNQLVAGIPEVHFVPEPVVARPAPTPITISVTLDHSGSAIGYLEEAGMDRDRALEWAREFRSVVHSDIMRRGHSLALYKDPETGELRGFKYDLNERLAIYERTYGEGIIHAYEEPVKYIIRPVAVAFKVHHNFWREAELNDVPKPIVATLEYAFQDRHSLAKLPPGTAVKLIYQEKLSRDGTMKFVTGLEAAQLDIDGKTLDAFAFRGRNGRARLYDANGNALGPETLHFPVHFQYISSRFSMHRYQPILHIYRPHLGVDLAARWGTPVHAIADGRIETAGWCGQLGYCVRINHENGVISLYGHLSHITRGLRPGTFVHMGEVIGRVGSTGLSTGPHLHFGIERDGRFVNPLTQRLGVNHHVSPRMRALFDRLKNKYLVVLDNISSFGSHIKAPWAYHEPAVDRHAPAVKRAVARRNSRSHLYRVHARVLPTARRTVLR